MQKADKVWLLAKIQKEAWSSILLSICMCVRPSLCLSVYLRISLLLLRIKLLCLDVCVRGHQELNLRQRSEDRSRDNAPKCPIGILCISAVTMPPSAQ
jgi:hypothetical protein